MRHRIAIPGLLLACLLSAETEPQPTPQVRNTEHVNFPENGTLRFQNSVGELTVEGWDRPGVEITTIKSAKPVYSAKESEKARHELERIRVTTKQQGNELVVTTEFPGHSALAPARLTGSESFDLEYLVKAPRNATLVVDHRSGGIHVDDMAGKVHINAKQGTITLRLEGDSPRTIDARSRFGSVNSDFPGTEKPKTLHLGHGFAQTNSGVAQELYLHVGYGDVVIVKANHPRIAVTPPAGPTGARP